MGWVLSSAGIVFSFCLHAHTKRVSLEFAKHAKEPALREHGDMRERFKTDLGQLKIVRLLPKDEPSFKKGFFGA